MNRASLRTEPISLHLARHRDCLERRRAERGIGSASAGGRNDVPERAPSDRHDQPYALLPFERQDDDE
jgi:hypothetical protein